MTEQEKTLLFHDLCSRLPYNTLCSVEGYDTPYELIGASCFRPLLIPNFELGKYRETITKCVDEIKPYLRPWTSLTEEEECLLADCGFVYDVGDKDIYNYDEGNKRYNCVIQDDLVDLYYLFNSHHIDYNNLIPSGLAIEAPKDMYQLPKFVRE